jgi:hypothetical protein
MSQWRQCCWILSGLLAVIAVGAGIVWAISPQHRIGPEAYEKITKGMTRSDVEEIIGASPGNYTRTRCFEAWGNSVGVGDWLFRLEVRVESWVAETGGIYVLFNQQDAVVDKRFVSVVPCVDLWTRTRHRLGLMSRLERLEYVLTYER